MRTLSPPLTWPNRLRRPPATIKLVYLDLNHWIYLAQARSGHSSGRRTKKVLDACRAARSAGNTLFVLSQAHYMEMDKIRDPRQRHAVAETMEDLTSFATLIGRATVMEVELDAVLDFVAPQPSQLNCIPLLGQGVLHTAGLGGRLRVYEQDCDKTDEFRVRLGPERFDRMLAETKLSFERSVLRGPTVEEVEELRELGWNPERHLETGIRRAEQEQKQRLVLDGDGPWRRERLRDVVTARELILEFENILPRLLAERGMTVSSFADEPSARELIGSMPSTAVAVTLKTAWHRNLDKPWSANDIYDIDALSVAVPYCDIVVTEKACHHVLQQANVGQLMDTAILRNLEDLLPALEALVPSRP